jgi:dynein light intermediate chain 2
LISERVSNILSNLEKRGSKRPQALRNYAWKRFGLEHPDEKYVNPFLSPILIIGTKYDLFKNFESEQRKAFCKTMRFMCHTIGASILFHSSQENGLDSKAKQFISHLAFKTNPPKTIITDHNQPLMIIAGYLI